MNYIKWLGSKQDCVSCASEIEYGFLCKPCNNFYCEDCEDGQGEPKGICSYCIELGEQGS